MKCPPPDPPVVRADARRVDVPVELYPMAFVVAAACVGAGIGEPCVSLPPPSQALRVYPLLGNSWGVVSRVRVDLADQLL